VARALAGVPVAEGFAARLAERRGLTPAQIRTAVRFARLAQPQPTRRRAVQALIERQLANADKALGGAPAERGARPWSPRVRPVAAERGVRFEVPRIVEALTRRGHGTLCFHGAPGTGKTALAEHIAQALGKPADDPPDQRHRQQVRGRDRAEHGAHVRRGHQRERGAAARRGRQLLAQPPLAERNYEVTEVNEMLQGMERFAGVFICTTNLFDDLDEAALAALHLQDPLSPADRGAACCACSWPRRWAARCRCGADGRAAAHAWLRWTSWRRATSPPCNARWRCSARCFEPDEFLSQLEGEHRVKPGVRQRRGIGFQR
jgi:hypothetical protein